MHYLTSNPEEVILLHLTPKFTKESQALEIKQSTHDS